MTLFQGLWIREKELIGGEERLKLLIIRMFSADSTDSQYNSKWFERDPGLATQRSRQRPS